MRSVGLLIVATVLHPTENRYRTLTPALSRNLAGEGVVNDRGFAEAFSPEEKRVGGTELEYRWQDSRRL